MVEESGHQGREGGHGDEAEAAHQDIQDFGGHKGRIENVARGKPLGHEEHKHGDVAGRIGQEQGRGHGADDGPAHPEAGAQVLPESDVLVFLFDFIHGRGNVHGQVHDGPGGGDEDPGNEDIREPQIIIP